MSLPARGRIHHVASVVRDIDASIDFHTRVLGLALEQVAEVPSQEVRIAFLTAGDSKIELSNKYAKYAFKPYKISKRRRDIKI